MPLKSWLKWKVSSRIFKLSNFRKVIQRRKVPYFCAEFSFRFLSENSASQRRRNVSSRARRFFSRPLIHRKKDLQSANSLVILSVPAISAPVFARKRRNTKKSHTNGKFWGTNLKFIGEFELRAFLLFKWRITFNKFRNRNRADGFFLDSIDNV